MRTISPGYTIMSDKISLPPRFQPIPAARFAILIAVAALLLVSIANVAPGPGKLIDGAPDLMRLAARMWPPNLEQDFLLRMGARILETFQIALAGAVIGIIISLPLGWLAARDVSPLPALTIPVKALVSLMRTVPDLVWALIFVATVGLGAVAGTLTIIVDTIGFCGRFFSEALEEADRDPQDALTTMGANRFQVLLAAVLPDAAPSMVNTSLFVLEKAVRSSVILGLVGAGGIGQELQVAFDLFQYPNAATIILAIFAIVLVMEFLTDHLRQKFR